MKLVNVGWMSKRIAFKGSFCEERIIQFITAKLYPLVISHRLRQLEEAKGAI
jgi:hypothetical protein